VAEQTSTITGRIVRYNPELFTHIEDCIQQFIVTTLSGTGPLSCDLTRSMREVLEYTTQSIKNDAIYMAQGGTPGGQTRAGRKNNTQPRRPRNREYDPWMSYIHDDDTNKETTSLLDSGSTVEKDPVFEEVRVLALSEEVASILQLLDKDDQLCLLLLADDFSDREVAAHMGLTKRQARRMRERILRTLRGDANTQQAHELIDA
jgi:hypothetical protein